MKLTEHFTRCEMEKSAKAEQYDIPNVCPDDLLGNMTMVAMQLEKIRDHYGVPVDVSSCYRSPAVNRLVGGSKTSAHCSAMAADFTVRGIANIDVCRWASINIPEFDQIINEFPESESGGWVHIGFTHKTPRRQLMTANKGNPKTVYLNGLHG